LIVVERVDFLGVPVLDLAEADAHFRDLALFERNARSTERWVEYEAPNVTLALVPNAYTGGREHEPLPFAAFAVRVDDIEAERKRLSDGGVDFLGDGFDSGVCLGAPFVALDGNGLLLHHRYATFKDGRSPEAPRGRVDFVAVPTRDRDRAEEFYGGMLGLERNPRSSETWVEYEAPNVTLAFVDPAQAGQEFKTLPPGTIAFRAADVEAAKAELAAAGVEFPAGVIDSGVCHIAPFSDPDGNGLMLHRRYAPFADGTQP
jgi:catechol 2,3-dioxygenase-like lactoylglutathione lyase family enzyme